MKPDGQIPAYEWNFSDVNPPVHAWATFRVFKIERKLHGREDLPFLERVFQKLLLNFTWCVPKIRGVRIYFWLNICKGGSTVRTRMETTFLRAGSWAWTTLAPSIGQSLCQQVESSVKRMEQRGWLSTVSTCEALLVHDHDPFLTTFQVEHCTRVSEA